MAAVLALAALAACGRPARNVLLITVDTLRADRLSCYGYAHNQTPSIDALAARGVAFDRAFCDVTWTTPSMASVFTGRYVVHHGLRMSSQRLEETQTLAKTLRGWGYTTAAVIGSFPVDSSFGLSQGFDLYDEAFNTSVVKDEDPARLSGELPPEANEIAQRNWLMLRRMARAYRPDDQVAARAIRWLTAERREPFFLWVHFFGPHEKMYVHLSFKQHLERNLAEYDRDVSIVDAQVGALLRGLDDNGLASRTLVILHADHGQELFEHRYVGHGRDLYDATLHIPLIIADPSSGARGTHVGSFARNIDLFPTVMDLLDLPSPADVDGHSVALAVRHPWLARLRGMKQGETYAETHLSATSIFRERMLLDGREYSFGFVRRGVRSTDWKYVESEPVPLVDDPAQAPLPSALVERKRRRELYDLRRDPTEMRDVSAANPEVVTMLREKLAGYTRAVHNAPAAPLDEASAERLRALGYVE
ncbi:MAG: sulfatase [Deltaproteobacteria bacterium]|nr:sulfatase [Deltaproteobacteria bacterium]